MALAARTLPLAPPGVPAVIREFVAQLLDPDFCELVRAGGDRQVDVRLSASNGRVRKPSIAFDAGPQPWAERGE